MKTGDLRYYHTRVVRVSRSALRMRAFSEVWNLHRGPANKKAVSPNADLLIPLKLLARFGVRGKVLEGEDPPEYVALDDVLEGREKITLAGLLRALVFLRAYDESAYRAFVDAARVLSVQVDDRFVLYPPGYYLLTQGHDYFVEAFGQLEDRHGVSVSDYVAALCVMLRDEAEDISEHVAIFWSTPEADREKIDEFCARFDEEAKRKQVERLKTRLRAFVKEQL